MIQSLSPLAFLTMISNFNFETVSVDGMNYGVVDFIKQNIVLLIVFIICFIWVVASLFFLLSFGRFKWRDKESGYKVKNVKEHEGAGLNFFLTLIIPLLIDNVNTLSGAITLGVIVFLICMLLYKTNLYFSNPVLSILGYRIFEFAFCDNSKYKNKTYLAICRNKIHDGSIVDYKSISEEVFYVKES